MVLTHRNTRLFGCVRMFGTNEAAKIQTCTEVFFFCGCWNGVLVQGVKDKGDVKNTDSLQRAYELGKSIE